MNKIKVMTIVGTRPEVIRLSRVISKMDEYFDHILVHTGQNYDYELNKIFFDDLEIKKPDYFLETASDTYIKTISNMLVKIDELFEKIKPEAILILGDTNSCLCAYPAKRRKIPIFHMEAGNRCFDQRVPEETNRKIVDHISDINLPYSDIAREYLIKEGFPSERIIKTGSPMYEVINYYLPKIKSSKILEKLGLEKEKYFVVSFHREENVDNMNNLLSFIDILNSIAEKYKFPIMVSTHPRTRKKIEQLKNVIFNDLIIFHNPFSFTDYVNLEINSFLVISDSGTITEESSILNFPAINIREAHERPEGMEEASVIMSGFRKDIVLNSIEVAVKQNRKERNFLLVKDYFVPNVSEKIPRIIISYIDYINKNIWKK
ncbi:MAG: UDP-N-acetylglucosamine 2-epimerase (non-hydrolyzing) [Spirochaetes bacterium]|nr:UDP-N-acetylglucosamine 2-epimerase (non-hydrolyzing) [Spirochaetota bacterium]